MVGTLGLLVVVATALVVSACSRTEEPAVVTLPEQSATTSIPTMLAPDDEDDAELPTEPLEIAWVIQVGGPGDDVFNGVTSAGALRGSDDEDSGAATPNVVAVGASTADLTEPAPRKDERADEPDDDATPGSEDPFTDGGTDGGSGDEATPGPEDPFADDGTDDESPDLLVTRLASSGELIRNEVVGSHGPTVATSVSTVHAPGPAGTASSLPIACGFSMGDLAGQPLGLSDGWCGPVATRLDTSPETDDLARIFGFGFTMFAAEANESINDVAATGPDDVADLAAAQNMFLAGSTDGMFPGAGDSAGRGLGQGDALTFRTSLRDGTSWIRQFGTPFPDAATSVCTTDGNGYFVGWTEGDLAGRSAGGRDGWISMIDAAGMQRWLVQFGYDADEEFRSVACTGDPAEGTQQFIAVGSTTGDGPRASHGGRDALIASFAPDGSTLWATQIGGSGDDLASGVVFADGVIYVVGSTDSPAEPDDDVDDPADEDRDERIAFGTLDDTIGPGGSRDAFLTAVDARTGSILWTSRFGSDTDETVTSATITPDGLLVVAGSTAGGLGDYESAGRLDAFVVAFELPTSGGGGAQSWV